MDSTFPIICFDTVIGLNPKSLHIWFLDFSGFMLFNLAAPSTCFISSIHTCITSALHKLMFFSWWVLPPWSPGFFMPFGVSGHLTLHAIFKWHENKSIKIKRHEEGHGYLKLPTTKEGTKKISGSNNINWLPGPTMQMKEGMALVTFN